MSNEPVQGWERRRLSEVADVVSGGTPSRDIPNYWTPSEIEWVTPTDITRGNGRTLIKSKEQISNIGLSNCSAKILPINSILMTSRATLGEMKVSAVECCTNQGFKSLIPKNSTNVWFLFYQMKLNKFKYEALGIGSTFLEVNKKDTDSFEIDIPPLPQQQKIAKILSTADNLLEQTQALIDKYTAIKQGMMADLFTRGIDLSGTPETNINHGQLRPSFEEEPELYKETDLGWIPRDWEALTIQDVATKVTDGDHHTPLRSDEGVLLLSARNIHNGYLELGNVDYVPRFEYERMINRCHPEPGDILISCSGTIGRVCEVPKDIIFSLVRSVALVKLNFEKISSRYSEWFLKDEKSRKAMFDSSLQAAQPNLFQSAIKSLPLLLPELNEQKEIARRLDGFESLIQLERDAMKQREEIKKGLMQDLLTGKVRVNA